ncbi:MAG TPA: interleukin-like EMT inducer domain-containing protein, partial [Anaerolineae bacterium]
MGGQYVNFDTDGDKNASAGLAAWVAALPPGTIVAGAVRDEASMNLRPEAVQAIAELGVKGDLRGKFRWGQAFIGVKGAAPGTALESTSAIVPAQVSLGAPASAPQAAAAFTRVTVVASGGEAPPAP